MDNFLSTNIEENLILEEKITCGKIKSKAKTIMISQVPIKYINNNISNPIDTIKFSNIKINIPNINADTNLTQVISLLMDSTIIISTQSNPKVHIPASHLLVLPGYLIFSDRFTNKTIDKNLQTITLNFDLFFSNFFPSNIPLGNTNIYFMIWFKKIIPQNIITNISVNYFFSKLILNESNVINFKKEDNNNNVIYTQKLLCVQQTQTYNVMCANTYTNLIVKKCCFENMCRGFWIKILHSDYNNFDMIELELNGNTRFNLSQNQIELLGIKKNIFSNYILIFINLEFEDMTWNLPQDINKIAKIYSNSLNCSRIDNVKFKFKLNNKHYIKDNIVITSLNLNLFDYINYKFKYELWNA